MILIASRFPRILERSAFLGFLLVFSGCLGPAVPDGMPELYPCKLNLSMGGAPLEGASVTLHPVGDGAYTAGGTTDGRGDVEVMTGGKYKGAPLGRYRVTVQKTRMVYQPGFEPENIKIKPTGDEVQDRKTRYAIAQDHGRMVNQVAPVFSAGDRTSLELEVTAGKNQFKFAVEPAANESKP